MVINFDLLFYKFISASANNFSSLIFNLFESRNLNIEKENYKKILLDTKNTAIIVIGLDLLNEININNFFTYTNFV